jgi:hypothetical protein
MLVPLLTVRDAYAASAPRASRIVTSVPRSVTEALALQRRATACGAKRASRVPSRARSFASGGSRRATRSAGSMDRSP